MDLGATLCPARQPALRSAARWPTRAWRTREGRPERYPVKTRRLKRGTRAACAAVAGAGRARSGWCSGPTRGVWAGLWSLPEFDTPDALRQRLRRLARPRRGAAG